LEGGELEGSRLAAHLSYANSGLVGEVFHEGKDNTMTESWEEESRWSSGWTQQDEEGFVRHIGTMRKTGLTGTLFLAHKKLLLHGYLKGLDLRNVWGTLSKERLRTLALSEVKKLEDVGA
jgi:hypothetical protein